MGYGGARLEDAMAGFFAKELATGQAVRKLESCGLLDLPLHTL